MPPTEIKNRLMIEYILYRSQEGSKITFVADFPGHLEDPFIFMFSAEAMIEVGAIGKVDRVHARIKTPAHAIR